MRDVKSCAGYRKCVFPTGVPSCTAATNTCSGNIIVQCDDGVKDPRAVSCEAEGRTCTKVGSSAQCSGAKGVNCPVLGTRCENGNIVSCDGNGLDQGETCSAIGATCKSVAGNFVCLPPAKDAGDTCTIPGSVCNGAVAEACIDQVRSTVDCARLKLPCQANRLPNTFLACQPAAPVCGATSCSGSTLTACVRGQETKIACADLGLGPCSEDAGARASCTPQ
jgi:hypothetical protein